MSLRTAGPHLGASGKQMRLCLLALSILSACHTPWNPFLWRRMRSQVRVYYITDRLPEGENYGGQRDSIHYGYAEIEMAQRVPKYGISDGRITGSTRTQRMVSGIIDSTTSFEYRRYYEIPETTFFRLVRDAAKRDTVEPRRKGGAARGNGLLFIHGYNNSFEAAVTRAAALGFRVDARPIIAFSWPSRSNVFSYVTDLDQARYGSRDLDSTLIRLLSVLPPIGINVIVHSMGSQVLAGALETDPNANLSGYRSLTLVDPDFDSQLFVRDALPLYRRFSPRVTIYGTGRDVPLLAAKMLRSGYPRIGELEGKAFSCPPGIDCVDLSEALPKGDWTHHFDVLAPNSPVVMDFSMAVTYANPGLCRAAEGAYTQRGNVWIMRAHRAEYVLGDVPEECQQYGLRNRFVLTFKEARASLIARIKQAFTAEHLVARIDADSSSVVSDPYDMGGHFLMVHADLKTTDGGIRLMVLALRAARAGDFGTNGKGELVEDESDSRADWQKLEALVGHLTDKR